MPSEQTQPKPETVTQQKTDKVCVSRLVVPLNLWLQSQASGKGHGSVGKWADSAGRKAPKRKGNNVAGEATASKKGTNL